MQRAIIFSSVVLFAALAAGCTNTESVSSSMNNAAASEISCSIFNYGISEFNLVSSMPTLSGSYDLKVSVEQLGDCVADELLVTIYQDDNFVSQYKLIGPKQTTPLTIKWSPNVDGSIRLTAKLEIMDDDTDNNKESISVLVNPLGNYQRINDLSSETFSGSMPCAELLATEVPIQLSNVDLYLQKSPEGAEAGTLIVQLKADNNGSPGEVLKQVEQSITLYDQFDWYQIPLDISLNAGNYWVVLTMKDGQQGKWHYSRKPAGGAQDLSGDIPKYATNNTSQFYLSNKWVMLPDKDFSFKVHAGGNQ